MSARILGINGSIRAGSTADRALRFALAELEALGAQCSTFDIGQLPALDGRPDEAYPASVGQWRAACTEAEALLVAVPSYHGGAPGSVKNALDFVDIPHLGGKPFAVLGIAGGDAEPAVTDVTRVMRHIGGVAATADVVISRASEQWGPGGEPRNRELASAIQKMAKDLLALCALWAEGKLPQP